MQDFKVPPITKIIFQATLEVRISDINYGNHLGHDSLISLLHEARMRFLKNFGYMNELTVDGLGVLITNLAVNYVNEAFYSDKLVINIGVGEVSRTSLQLIYQVIKHEGQKEIARALTTMTFYDYKNSRVAKIPQPFLSSIGLDES